MKPRQPKLMPSTQANSEKPQLGKGHPVTPQEIKQVLDGQGDLRQIGRVRSFFIRNLGEYKTNPVFQEARKRFFAEYGGKPGRRESVDETLDELGSMLGMSSNPNPKDGNESGN